MAENSEDARRHPLHPKNRVLQGAQQLELVFLQVRPVLNEIYSIRAVARMSDLRGHCERFLFGDAPFLEKGKESWNAQQVGFASLSRGGVLGTSKGQAPIVIIIAPVEMNV